MLSKQKAPKVEATKKKGRANSIDEHVGLQLRQRRALMGYSQEKLAEQVGITFQQIQKYENGANRVSASRLYEFSKVLDIPVSFSLRITAQTKTGFSSAFRIRNRRPSTAAPARTM